MYSIITSVIHRRLIFQFQQYMSSRKRHVGFVVNKTNIIISSSLCRCNLSQQFPIPSNMCSSRYIHYSNISLHCNPLLEIITFYSDCYGFSYNTTKTNKFGVHKLIVILLKLQFMVVVKNIKVAYDKMTLKTANANGIVILTHLREK